MIPFRHAAPRIPPIGLALFALAACTAVEPVEAPPRTVAGQANGQTQEQTRRRAEGQTGGPLIEVNELTRTEPPSLLFPGLFQAVAEAALFPTKDWVDATPLESPDAIMADWQATRPATQEALAAFVATHFELPEAETSVAATQENATMRGHIEALWPELTRDAIDAGPWSSLLSLPEPYIVPGGRFREVYYWDAYFTMEGMGPAWQDEKRAMVDNFAALIERYGFIPNANRTYYLSRSQPPFFFKMVGLLSPDDPAAAWAAYLPQLKAEHDFWMQGAHGLAPGAARLRVVRLADGALLNRYWDARRVPRDESYNDDMATAAAASRPDPIVYRNLRAGAESGWDFSSRWFEGAGLSSIETTFIIPPDLNAILYGLEQAIAEGCEHTGDTACAAAYEQMAKDRRAAMTDHLWNEDIGLYDDYDFVEDALKDNISAAALYPLFFGLATRGQADATAGAVETHLLAPGGLLSTNRETGEQWDAPNGWAPLHWIAVNGLADYGHEPLARTIAERWLATAARTYCTTGKMVEKYDVTQAQPGGGGEYPTQDGFGWTNGVTIALMDKYDEFNAYGEISAAPGADALARCADLVTAAAP